MTDEQTTAQEETADTAEQQERQEMRTEDALRYAIAMFAELAWLKLGLRADPATGETKIDAAQARLAIDALNGLVQLTEGRFDPREVRDYHNLVSSLQLNFVQKTVGSSG